MRRVKYVIRFIWFATILFVALGLLRRGEVVRNVFRDTLAGCFASLLPVLFPYMVLARLIVSLDLFSPFVRLLRLDRKLHVPSALPVVWLLGNLCGYPIGAAECAALVRQNKLSAEHAGILCALASHGNPVYIVQIAGILWWKSMSFGIGLLLAQLCFTTLVTTFILFWRRAERESTGGVRQNNAISGAGAFSAAIRESSMACVAVCGSIVFFSIVIALLPPMHPVLSALLAAILEFTSGVEAGALQGDIAGAAITGFALGFGGLSVLMQVAEQTDGTGISLVPTILMKCADGVWMASAAALLYRLRTVYPASAVWNPMETSNPWIFGWAIFTLGLLCRAGSFWKKAEIFRKSR